MDERDDLETRTRQLRLFDEVFRATWQGAVGRRWPSLAGDVEALCHQAFALGVAHGLRGTRAEAPYPRLVAEPRQPFRLAPDRAPPRRPRPPPQ